MSPNRLHAGSPVGTAELLSLPTFDRYGNRYRNILAGLRCAEALREQSYSSGSIAFVGDVGLDRSFYFRGPQSKANIRAESVLSFARMASTVDDET